MNKSYVQSKQPRLLLNPRAIITTRFVLYSVYAFIAAGLGLLSVLFSPFYVIGGVAGILVFGLVLRYPYFGFILYMLIYILRPGERFPELAPLRLELLTGLLLLVIVAIASAINGKGVRFPLDNVSKAFLLFFIALGFSFVFSEWKMGSYEEIMKFVKIFILYYFIVVFVDTEKRFQIAIWLITILTSVIGIEAAFNYFTGNYRLNQGVMRTGGATSYGEHANSMAMYMATTIPFLIYLYMKYKHLFSRILMIVAAVICLVTLIITGSRSGVLTMIGVFLAYAWFSKKRVAYIIVIILFATASWFALPGQYKERYGSIVSSNVDGSSQGRLDAWKAGLQMFIEKPVFGVGIGVFAPAYHDRGGVYLNSHSLYIETISTTGAAGTFFWGLLIFRMIKLLKGTKNRMTNNREMTIDLGVYRKACYAILVGLFIGGVFGHILLRDTWYIVAGLVIARMNGLEKLEGLNEHGSAEAAG